MAIVEDFKRIIDAVVAKKGIKLSISDWDGIMRVGKGIKRGETTAENVVSDLQGVKGLRLGLDGSDWRRLKENMESMLRNYPKL